MRFEIRPFNETTDKSDVTAPNPAADQRASTFMDSLHARINSLDEAQREKWAKAAEAARHRPVARRREWVGETEDGEETPRPKARKPAAKAAPAKSGAAKKTAKPARRKE